MSKILIIGTEEFEFPEEGDNPSWGEQVSDWAEAVSDALQNVQAPNDVLRTSANIANNVTTPTNIPGFSFDTSEVVSINADYIIRRTTNSPTQILQESGYIEGNFDGTNWTISRRFNGDAAVELDITPAGQIQYTSSDLAGAGYSGFIIFRAKVFNQD